MVFTVHMRRRGAQIKEYQEVANSTGRVSTAVARKPLKWPEYQ
jgi:hypothetical protein